MDEEILRVWVDAYGRAWQRGDPDEAVLLFAEDAAYQEAPFAAHGRQAIHAYWALVRSTTKTSNSATRSSRWNRQSFTAGQPT